MLSDFATLTGAARTRAPSALVGRAALGLI